MPDAIAPYRADEVGSLLRSGPLKEARARRASDAISASELRAIEDEEIRTVIRKQENAGLKLATDGELRRTWWQFDFFEGLKGVEVYQAEKGIQFKGVETTPRALRVTGKVDFQADHPMLEHFRFLAANTSVTPKMTVPAPANLHFRNGRKTISTEVYPDLGAFFDDLATTYGKVIRAFYDAGCRYLQLDDTTWGYLCSADERALARTRGDDNVDELPRIYAEVTNRALKSKPADMVVTTHVCRGNFRSRWISEGGYEPVAEQLLAGTDYDGYFMEWDTDRAGGLEPLRFLPKGNKRVVVGLVTSKTGTLESKDDLKRRLDEAARYAPLDQLCLSPQCGFASTEEGNDITEEEQWAKLRLVVETAREVWGDSR